jgi:hypothetical protein
MYEECGFLSSFVNLIHHLASVILTLPVITKICLLLDECTGYRALLFLSIM